MREWSFVWDMNGDGVFTVSDLWTWVSWLFFYPGDYVLLKVMADPNLARFLEVDPMSYGGVLSGVLSALAWFIALLLWGMLGLLWELAAAICESGSNHISQSAATFWEQFKSFCHWLFTRQKM